MSHFNPKIWLNYFFLCCFIAAYSLLNASSSSGMDFSTMRPISEDVPVLKNAEKTNHQQGLPFSSVVQSLMAACPQFPSSVPFPPTDLRARQVANKFATQTDLINIITWDRPIAGPTPAAYYIYRNASLHQLAAIIPAGHKLKFKDHNRKPHETYSYFIVAVDASGAQSPPVGITISGHKVHHVENVVPVAIAIHPASASITIGTTQQFFATVTYSDGTILDLITVNWCSADPSIVFIDANGVARGLFVGTTTITASTGDVSSTATITVTTVPCATPVIVTSTLPGGVIGLPYLATVSATGTAPITYSISSGSLPPGLTLNPITGEISGVPSTETEGTYSFTVLASNACGSDSRAFTITICNPPVITTTTINTEAVEGFVYNPPNTIVATGSAPITFSIVAGSLPSGLTLDSVTGVISGTPTVGSGSAQGTPYPFTVEATNGCGSSTQSYEIIVFIVT